MTFAIDRRFLLKAGTVGLGALAVPGGAQLLAARGFTHDVASGEPRANSVMLWTRYVPASGDSARLEYQVSTTADFTSVVGGGSVTAEAERDYCVKPMVEGLAAGRTLHYRFVDGAGRFSPVGRTRTLPEGAVDRFRIGVFSCANLPFGWFNAYAHAAGRDDLDLMLHLGDYLYEYESGKYPAAAEALAGRLIEPAGEIVALADYRLRHAAYRSDPDLQRLHRRFPMIMMWDDHESANDSWRDGAENHQPEREGAWAVRKAAAVRAYREWLPVSENAWESYEFGDLATLFRPETRLTARSRPLSITDATRGQADMAAALSAFRDGPWRDPERTLLGAEQESWLAGGLLRSARAGTKWQLLGQQVIMGSTSLPPEAAGWMAPDVDARVRRAVESGLVASRAGLPLNFDAWDGFPAARDRLLRSSLDADANLIVLSGDSHNAWAFDLDLDATPAGAEFAGHSVTSSGLEAFLPRIRPDDIVRALVGRNPQLKWADTSRRGYLTLELTPERATGEWVFLDTIRERSTRLLGTHRMSVTRGTNRLG